MLRRTISGIGIWPYSLTAAVLVSATVLGQEGPPAKQRFVDKGEYVEDTKTGLLWQKDGEASGKMGFHDAAKYAKGLKLGGLTGWRVPTAKELAGIFPADQAPFTNSAYNKNMCCDGPQEFRSYWTSELDERIENYAFIYTWYAAGGANNGGTGNQVYVRCVLDSGKAAPAGNGKPTDEKPLDGKSLDGKSLDEADTRAARELIVQLGHDSYEKREAAAAGLKAMGRKVLPLLIVALEQAEDAEVRFRLKGVMKELGK